MTLTENFKKEAAFTIEGFWHGYFLGTIEGQLIQAFFHDFKREMTLNERTELDQIISIYDVYLLEAVEKLK